MPDADSNAMSLPEPGIYGAAGDDWIYMVKPDGSIKVLDSQASNRGWLSVKPNTGPHAAILAQLSPRGDDRGFKLTRVGDISELPAKTGGQIPSDPEDRMGESMSEDRMGEPSMALEDRLGESPLDLEDRMGESPIELEDRTGESPSSEYSQVPDVRAVAARAMRRSRQRYRRTR